MRQPPSMLALVIALTLAPAGAAWARGSAGPPAALPLAAAGVERDRPLVVPSHQPGDHPLVKLRDGRVVDHTGRVVRVERPPWWDGVSPLVPVVGYGVAVLGLAGVVSLRRRRRPSRPFPA